MVKDWSYEAEDFNRYNDPENNFTISYDEVSGDGKNIEIQLIGYFSKRKGRKLTEEYPFDFIVDVKNKWVTKDDLEY